jgi:hypothetical protein
MKRFKCILAISDAHLPWQHRDMFRFLKAVKRKYKPDKVVNIGDEVDHHAISMHDHSPDLPSPDAEMELALIEIKKLYKIFPKVDVVDSNHGSLVFRRAAKYGLPKRVIKSYAEQLEAPKGWVWHDEIVLHGSDGEPILFHHGNCADSLKASKNKSMRIVQGHFHAKFDIQYWANSLKLYWGMTIGCLVDKDKLAFAYGKNIPNKPILGVGVIRNGHPLLVPMIIDRRGRWTGWLP